MACIIAVKVFGCHEALHQAARPKKVSREYVVSQLAQEYFLSVKTVERLLYVKGSSKG